MNSGLSFFPVRSFLGIGSIVFSGTQQGVQDLRGIVHERAGFFGNILPQKWGKWAKMDQTQGSLNLLENLVIVSDFGR